MNWDDLRHVLALSRTGSLVAAGRLLGVEHTTVGRRITSLEQDLGARLFSKTPDGHRPTSAGLQVISTAESVESAMLAMQAAVTGEDDRREGIVRLTTSEGFLPILAAHLARLYAEHPGIRVEILTANRVFDLSRGEADIALRFAPTIQPDLIARKVGTAGWALYASASYLAQHGRPEDPHKLNGHRVVGFDAPLTHTPGGEWLAAHGGGAEIVFRGNGIPSVQGAVAAGIGLSCLPHLTGASDARLLRVSDVVTEGPVWLVVHPDRIRTARVRVVHDFLLDVCERERPLLTGHPNAGT